MSYERVFDLKKPSAQSGAETRSSSNTSWVFGSVSKESNGFQETICHYGWDLDLPLYTGNKKSVETVNW
jgi:hypothetical protein